MPEENDRIEMLAQEWYAKSRAIPINSVYRDTLFDLWEEAGKRWDHSVTSLVETLVSMIKNDTLDKLSRHMKIERMEVEGKSEEESQSVWLKVENPLEQIPLRLRFDEISE